jgi:hypothetical protein
MQPGRERKKPAGGFTPLRGLRKCRLPKCAGLLTARRTPSQSLKRWVTPASRRRDPGVPGENPYQGAVGLLSALADIIHIEGDLCRQTVASSTESYLDKCRIARRRILLWESGEAGRAVLLEEGERILYADGRWRPIRLEVTNFDEYLRARSRRAARVGVAGPCKMHVCGCCVGCRGDIRAKWMVFQ